MVDFAVIEIGSLNRQVVSIGMRWFNFSFYRVPPTGCFFENRCRAAGSRLEKTSYKV